MAGSSRKSGDIEAALALAAGATVADASARSGMSERTIYRRLATPEFAKAVDEARAAMFARAVGRLAATSERAVERLAELLECDSATIALQAARTILDAGPRLRDAVELAGRLTTLEAEMEAAREAQRPNRAA